MDEIKNMLSAFVAAKKIPNIIFHGPNCVGKRSILMEFINQIYGGNKEVMRENVMMVNCAYGKGIRFIRDELKFYAKSNLRYKTCFKSIILSNADNLTIDAQSALRRCIEVFSHSTRFFMIAENKYKLLSPILSRFCEIHIPEKFVDGYSMLPRVCSSDKIQIAKDALDQLDAGVDMENIINMANLLYRQGVHSFHIIDALKDGDMSYRAADTIMKFDECRIQFKNEQLLITFLFNYHYRHALV